MIHGNISWVKTQGKAGLKRNDTICPSVPGGAGLGWHVDGWDWVGGTGEGRNCPSPAGQIIVYLLPGTAHELGGGENPSEKEFLAFLWLSQRL